MTSRFDVFRGFSSGLFSYAIDAFLGDNTKDSNKGSNMIAILLLIICLSLLIVLLYAGAETVFLLTRKNFGTKGVKKVRAIISSLAFLVLAYLCYSFYQNYYGVVIDLGSEISFCLASLTFSVVGVLVFLRGMTAGGKDDNDVIDPIYRGDSWLLGGLVKEKWSQSVVQDIAEPLLFLAIGFYLTSFNYIWGLPFIFCAVSCWFHLGVESVFGFFEERKELSNEGLVYTQNRKVSKIVS